MSSHEEIFRTLFIFREGQRRARELLLLLKPADQRRKLFIDGALIRQGRRVIFSAVDNPGENPSERCSLSERYSLSDRCTRTTLSQAFLDYLGEGVRSQQKFYRVCCPEVRIC